MTDMLTPVYVNGRRVGTFYRIEDVRLGFDYDPAWRADTNGFPLSVSLPWVVPSHRDTPRRPYVSNFLWGLLPDNERTLGRWAAHFGIGRGNPLAFLRYVGADCPGALAFTAPGTTGAVEPLGPAALATEVRLLQQDAERSRLGGEFGHFSLAGAQAKTTLRRLPDGWGLPTGDAPSTHILKPAMLGLDAQAFNEHFCLTLARRLGLPAATSEVWTLDGVQAVLIERYDRFADDSGRMLRVHQEDMCQALGVHPTRKYEYDGGPSIQDMAAVLHEYSNDPVVDRARLFKAVLFNWLIAGTDAHAKNFSLLHGTGGRVRLAPLYDLNSLWPYYDRRNQLRSSLRIGGHYRFDAIRVRHFVREATTAGIREEEVVAMAREMAAQMPDVAMQITDEERRAGRYDAIYDRLTDGVTNQCTVLSKQTNAYDIRSGTNGSETP